jgi:hypothetical protein
MQADYGSTSLSDSLGNLLFYSDGQDVYNKLNNRMPHGDSLLSSGYATSPCVAFRMPGSLRKYYLFTVAGAPTTKWKPCVNYSIIDMSLDGGQAPAGVYTYIIGYSNQTENVRKKTGMMTLVR